MDILTIDMETFYDRYFSLSRITTEEYIRHELFETIGVSVKVNDEPAEWFSGTKKKTSEWLDRFNWGNSIAVAHNAMFDMAILSWEFDIRPKMIADTLSMARALHASEGISLSLKSLAEHYGIGVKGTEVLNALGKGRLDFTAEELARYGAYCVNDAELTNKLFAAMAPRIPRLEAKLIDLTMRMFTEPTLELDKCVLEDHLKAVKEKKEKLLDKALVDKANLMSNPQLAKMLEALGVDPPVKTSPATGKETFAFAKNDEEFKALLEHEDFLVQAIVAARLGVKSTLEETRTERFLQIAERGTLPVPLRYYAAHTGRWGGDDKVNLQNLPRKSPLKKAMRAPDGYLLVDCDSSQIEARTLAWLAEQGGLVQAFEDGEDVYKIMAASIYGKSVEEITEQERFVGKTTILGCGYGMGSKKFRAQLKTFSVDMDEKECERIIGVYREDYPMIPKLWSQGNAVLSAAMNVSENPNGQTAPFGRDGVLTMLGTGGILMPNGLHLRYPNLKMRYNKKTRRDEISYDVRKGKSITQNHIYGGKVVENICQALARIVIGEQMLMVARRYKVVMTVHDAVGALVPEAEASEGRKFIEDCMRIRPKWALGLPLNCESKIGTSYGG
jgi:DNA polymerase